MGGGRPRIRRRPLTKPLTELQIAKRLPTLDIRLGAHRPHVRGEIREYVAL